MADLFEVRADFVRDLDLAGLLRARVRPILLTCRSDAEGGRSTDAASRRRLLAEAVALGFDLVDVEARSGFDEVADAKRGRGLVLSWHDFDGTPADLEAIYERMAASRPDVVKIVTRARGDRRSRGRARLRPPARRRDTAARDLRDGTRRRRLAPPRRTLRRALHLRRAGQRPRGRARPGPRARVMADAYRVRRIAPATRVYGLLGSDVLRSLSPAIHNRAFAELGVDAVYVPLQAESLAGFLQALPEIGLGGFSVTRPYKQSILTDLAACDDAAARAGSVNTVVVRADGGLVGSSTDGDGVLLPLRRRTDLARKRVARARRGWRSARAAVLRSSARGRVSRCSRGAAGRPRRSRRRPVAPTHALDAFAALDWDVLLNATPVGSGALPGALPVPRELLRAGAIVFDMVYEPLRDAATRRGRGAWLRDDRRGRDARGPGRGTVAGLDGAGAAGPAMSEAALRGARGGAPVSRYSRQERFSAIGLLGQQRLRSARVLVVGCGALGSTLAETMTRAGVASLTVVDRDYVETRTFSVSRSSTRTT